jgi:MFS family permease
LTWSILLYAFSAFFAGFSTNLVMLLILRSTTFVGVCVEFVAAVAWLAEIFRHPRQREKVLGYTQAFSSIGGFMVAGANWLAVKYAMSLPGIGVPSFLQLGTITDAHAAWRYTLISGIIPAIPLIIIRPFLPESPIWAQKKAAGTLKRPSIAELFSPAFRRTTIVTTIMIACSYAAAFGAIQQVPQIVLGLPDVQAQVSEQLAKRPATAPAATRASVPATAPSTAPASRPDPRALASGRVRQENAARAGMVQEIGGLTGRALLAVLAIYIVSRRKLIRVFQVPGLFIMPIAFAYCATQNMQLLYVGIFFAGLVTVAQFSFWGNYLPRVYPVHLRGTGESFAANIGGRVFGTSFFFVTQYCAVQFFGSAEGSSAEAQLHAARAIAYTAAIIGFTVYVVGFLTSFFLPEPPKQDEE